MIGAARPPVCQHLLDALASLRSILSLSHSYFQITNVLLTCTFQMYYKSFRGAIQEKKNGKNVGIFPKSGNFFSLHKIFHFLCGIMAGNSCLSRSVQICWDLPRSIKIYEVKLSQYQMLSECVDLPSASIVYWFSVFLGRGHLVTGCYFICIEHKSFLLVGFRCSSLLN